MKKGLYYLAPEKYYYNYRFEATWQISQHFINGIYTRAYSIKQACYQFRAILSALDNCKRYDIDIDLYDIKIIESPK